MDFLLQLWAASFYLANKAFFSLAESCADHHKRQLKIIGWLFYICGVPPWVVIMVAHNNWIAASIEAGGVPAMMLGLYNVLKGQPSQNRWLNGAVELFTYGFVAFGVGYSFYEYGGIQSLSQLLEMGVMIGFLLGGYWMAKGRMEGWLFFALMNVCMGSLCWIQDKPLLAVQQGVSLLFVIYGFVSAWRKRRQDA